MEWGRLCAEAYREANRKANEAGYGPNSESPVAELMDRGSVSLPRTSDLDLAMSDRVKPALSAEEWAMGLEELCEVYAGESLRMDDLTPADRLKLAVRWLHEAGWFTREDVEFLRSQVGDNVDDIRLEAEYLADRIAALLPPKEL